MTDKLLPCPFCCADAEQDYTRSFRHLSGGRLDHGAVIYCTSCNADMIMCRADHPELSDEERMAVMVENWNRRTPPPQPNLQGHRLAMRAASKAYIEVAQQICSEGLEAAISAYLEVATSPQPNLRCEPVAWRVRVKSDDPEEWSLLPAGGGADYLDREGYECQPLYVLASEGKDNG